MNSTLKYSRRQFIRAAGLGAAALPMLEAKDSFGGSCLANPPKRVVFMVMPDGIDGTGRSYISGGETDFVLPAWMKTNPTGGLTLQAVRDEMIFLDGVKVSVNEKESVGSHEARPAVFNASPLFLNDGHMNHRVIAGGPTIDQVIATQLLKQGVKTPRSVLNVGIRSQNAYRAAWRGKEDPVQPENDPFKLASALFAGTTPNMPDPSLARRLQTRQLILTQQRKEIERFKRQLGKPDQIATDSWLASLDDLQKELMAPSVGGAGCEPPSLGAAIDIKATENHPKLLKAQFDLVAASLAADVSRVAMIEIDDSWGDNTFFTWLGADFQSTGKEDTENGNNHHALSHKNGDKKMTIDSWYHGQFAYFIDRLRSIQEGNGTLLDNTLIVITSDGRNGASHAVDNVPYLLAGGKNLGMKRGRYLKLNNPPKQQVLVAAAHAIGAELPNFGGFSDLPGLR
jgi:hypothetical protein